MVPEGDPDDGQEIREGVSMETVTCTCNSVEYGGAHASYCPKTLDSLLKVALSEIQELKEDKQDLIRQRDLAHSAADGQERDYEAALKRCQVLNEEWDAEIARAKRLKEAGDWMMSKLNALTNACVNADAVALKTALEMQPPGLDQMFTVTQSCGCFGESMKCIPHRRMEKKEADWCQSKHKRYVCMRPVEHKGAHRAAQSLGAPLEWEEAQADVRCAELLDGKQCWRALGHADVHEWRREFGSF